MRRPALALIALGLAMALGNACKATGSATDVCRQIESARCRQAPNCSDIDLGNPVHVSSQSDVDACISFYNDACLHGLVAADPGAADVNACIEAINGGEAGTVDCTVVEHPELAPACYWLEPTVEDAGTDADADADDGAEDADAADADAG